MCSYAQRVPLPAAWAGLRGAELATLSGVTAAVFVNPQCFVGGARSRAGALTMAQRAVALRVAAVYSMTALTLEVAATGAGVGKPPQRRMKILTFNS